MEDPSVMTVVGVPVSFADRSALVEAIATPRGDGRPDLLFAGAVVMEVGTDDHLQLDIRDHDPTLRRAFEAAAAYSDLTSEGLDAVDGHTMCLYLVDEQGGSIDSARRMVRFVDGLLARGGIAAKVESAGKAHSRAEWASYATDFGQVGRLLDAFVVMAGDLGSGGYTCGMHNLGLPDVATSDTEDLAVAGNLLWMFAQYLLFEEPELRTGHSFSIDADAPRYRLRLEPCTQFDPDDLFFNPFGVWHLDPA